MKPEVKKIKFDDDPVISFVVPVHAGHLDEAILKRCLMSLDDQDYENMEVVIVINGGTDQKLENTAAHFVDKDPNKFKLVQIDEPGACNARNVGFNLCRGDIVSFFNSDYRAKPGMVRMWVDTLLKNPDCGFAYGGYEYASAPAVPYWSKEFDPELLEVANYIDCGFPIWRKYVEKWDPEVKSLQDWDFWLSVIKKHKIKGAFIDRDLSFLAEPPRKGGLSNDSHKNWIDRVKFIKNKHGIPLRDIVVTSLGAPFHGQSIAKMIGADYRDDTITKPNEYKAVYLIGFYIKPNDPYNGHGDILGSFPEETKKIVHFVGADIYWLRKFPYESMKILAGVLKQGTTSILCENIQAQKELREFGIEAEIVPIPPYNDYELKPFPEEFKVGVYLVDGNQSDFDKYLIKHTLSIIQAMPDVQFSGYGSGAEDFKAPNFTHCKTMPKEKWKQFVYDHSCLLRLVRHDTLPMAACEFLMAGRNVVTNIPMKFAHYIDTSGKTPVDSWDIFAPGFSATRWPETKTKIVQEIRKLSFNGHTQKEFLKWASAHYGDMLNRDKYINRIYELAGVPRA